MISGTLNKMRTTPGEVVQYTLPIGDALIPLNSLLGKTLRLYFTGQIKCIACKRSIPKSYQQGYCFPCTRKLAQCDFCILQPQRCHFHLGTCREPEWGMTHCMIPHWVYLANTAGVKVGITRAHQAQTRWMDQGAVAALPMFEVKTRQQSGFLEVVFARVISDRTHWQNMLKGNIVGIDLMAERDRLMKTLKASLSEVAAQFEAGALQPIESEKIFHYRYPILMYPEKVKALNFDKTSTIQDSLQGIKGQYLIFEGGVLNIRKFAGYEISLEIE